MGLDICHVKDRIEQLVEQKHIMFHEFQTFNAENPCFWGYIFLLTELGFWFLSGFTVPLTTGKTKKTMGRDSDPRHIRETTRKSTGDPYIRLI